MPWSAKQKLDYLLRQPWTVVIDESPEGDKLLRVLELPGAVASGETADEMADDFWNSLSATLEAYLAIDAVPPMPANAPPLPWLNPDKDSQESPYRILKFEGGMARVVPSFSTTGATGPAQPEPAKVEPPLLVAAGGI